ncbi:Flavin-containing monooxygenase FMO GS-OX-like [Seminavis robusta]|uniref:Flavin-containing monooxygenase FMO GS-OX-like n=1 Tax=Seminavis robusta TaxID=568900 RepID=A0A9N8EDL7_9STRA|nr:Flavin-containing monooxygenase FMO GS-OX-like [Seminavis robusta]|eukprot:Sro1022_g232330.1 Flavin-containing monooxygenase FMO GS-OX-like (508) ;mRNA; f:9238-10831
MSSKTKDKEEDKEEEKTQKPPYEVIIIGSGPSGLISAKILLEKGSIGRETVPCEIRDDKDDTLVATIPSSPQPVYEELRANFPKDLTSFLGYDFDVAVSMFPKASTLATYYQRFGKAHGVDKVARYRQRVVQCRKQETKISSSSNDKEETTELLWTVETIDTAQPPKKSKQIFTSRRLLVANGHFRKAFAPMIPGLQSFQGEMIHSSAFVSPINTKKYSWQDKTVLIVGGGISGSDIGRILAKRGNCAKVIVSVRTYHPQQYLLLDRLVHKYPVSLRPAIDRIDPETGEFHFVEIPTDNPHKYNTSSKTTERPDVIVFATGYRYYFPFFQPPNNDSDSSSTPAMPFVRADGFKMERLYNRILSIDDPTLGFIGIPNQNLSPAIVMEYQAQWFVHNAVLHPSTLPSKKAMLQEWESRANDPSQDALGMKCSIYCNQLVAQVPGLRGFWTQVVMDRLPLIMRTKWYRYKKTTSMTQQLWWPLLAVLGAILALAWKYLLVADSSSTTTLA